MTPQVLCLYYSQSGQLREILESITRTMNAEVHFAPIVPEKAFPFPWNKDAFMDAMPESVSRTGTPVKLFGEDILRLSPDLVILGWSPWFLHPAQPVSGFLHTPQAATLLQGKKVVTVLGCRNMWLNAGECMKEELQRLGAEHVGNIVLEDRHSNYTSLLTIVRWMFTGRKEAEGRLPEAGVSAADIRDAARFGTLLGEALQNGSTGLQEKLNAAGAVPFRPSLLLLEKRGVKGFRKFSARIRAKGGPGNPARAPLVRAFGRLLTFSVFALNPIAATLARLQGALMRKASLREKAYFTSLRYEKGRF